MTFKEAIAKIGKTLQEFDAVEQDESLDYRGTLGTMGYMGLAMLNDMILVNKPRLVIETGVNNGASTLVILRAMAEAGVGRLISIDLPYYEGEEYDVYIQGIRSKGGALPIIKKGEECGWLVPKELRDRWTLYLGDSRTVLPQVLEEEGAIDMFFHDSEHSFDHMTFEYETAWPYIRSGGYLLSDDAHYGERAFWEFALEHVERPVWICTQGRFVAAEKP
jgi:predicted O-methyltransferase YrrM